MSATLNIIEDELGNLLGTIESKLNNIPAELSEDDLEYIEDNLEYVIEVINEVEEDDAPNWLLNTIEDSVLNIIDYYINRKDRLNNTESENLRDEIESLYNTVKVER